PSLVLYSRRSLLPLPSFPTRRSSDLSRHHLPCRASSRRLLCRTGLPETCHSWRERAHRRWVLRASWYPARILGDLLRHRPFCLRDRKSTRLNSSHVSISYAVFCLKKK